MAVTGYSVGRVDSHPPAKATSPLKSRKLQ
jgi:hypothetical protein